AGPVHGVRARAGAVPDRAVGAAAVAVHLRRSGFWRGGVVEPYRRVRLRRTVRAGFAACGGATPARLIPGAMLPARPTAVAVAAAAPAAGPGHRPADARRGRARPHTAWGRATHTRW